MIDATTLTPFQRRVLAIMIERFASPVPGMPQHNHPRPFAQVHERYRPALEDLAVRQIVELDDDEGLAPFLFIMITPVQWMSLFDFLAEQIYGANTAPILAEIAALAHMSFDEQHQADIH